MTLGTKFFACLGPPHSPHRSSTVVGVSGESASSSISARARLLLSSNLECRVVHSSGPSRTSGRWKCAAWSPFAVGPPCVSGHYYEDSAEMTINSKLSALSRYLMLTFNSHPIYPWTQAVRTPSSLSLPPLRASADTALPASRRHQRGRSGT